MILSPLAARSPQSLNSSVKNTQNHDQLDMAARMKTPKCPASRPTQPAWKPKIAVICRVYWILLGYRWTRKLCQEPERENYSVIQRVSDFVDCLTGRNVEIDRYSVYSHLFLSHETEKVIRPTCWPINYPLDSANQPSSNRTYPVDKYFAFDTRCFFDVSSFVFCCLRHRCRCFFLLRDSSSDCSRLLAVTQRIQVSSFKFSSFKTCTDLHRLASPIWPGLGQSSKRTSSFLHRKNLDSLDCVRLQLDHNASRACNHHALRHLTS